MATALNGSFSLIPEWMPAEYGLDEIRQTSAFLRITLRNRSVTRVDDDWAKSVRDTVRVSGYPLAVWFASSWWRLCWEPAPETTPNTDWSLSHEMHGAGYGYLWPPMRFESDGEMVSVICTPAAANSNEPVRYLTSCREFIPVRIFMEAIESFILTVLARLEAVGIQNTDLHSLWREVTKERHDARNTSYRKLEALLGFDPDEAPEQVTRQFLGLSDDAGEAAVAELAATRAGRDPSLMLRDIEKSMTSRGVTGTLSGISDLAVAGSHDLLPWNRGRILARATRDALDNKMDPISHQHLCDIFGLKIQDLENADAPMAGMPWSLAIRKAEGDQVSLLFRRKSLCGRRFEMARWISDVFSASQDDRWLPATDSKTARQKMQRAFAAEFLAPVESLQSFLAGHFSDEERIEAAGKHFGVSSLMIKSHLSNHGLVPPETVGIY